MTLPIASISPCSAVQKADELQKPVASVEKAECYFRLGQVTASLGRDREAESFFNACLGLVTNKSSNLYIECKTHIAMLQKIMGKQSEAEVSAKEALSASNSFDEDKTAAFLPQLAGVFRVFGMKTEEIEAQAVSMSHTVKRLLEKQAESASVVEALRSGSSSCMHCLFLLNSYPSLVQ